MENRLRDIAIDNEEKINTSYRPNTDSAHFFIAAFPFIERFQLVATVDKVSGKQEMRIEYLSKRLQNIIDGSKSDQSNNFHILDGESISCIHTGIAITTIEEIQSIPTDDSKETFFYNMKTEEDLQSKAMGNLTTTKGRKGIEKIEIRLTPEEHFFALKSWVQGIAESGMGFLKNLEILNKFPSVYSIITRLFSFMVRYSDKFIQNYLTFIEKECIFEGKPHISSLIASLRPLSDSNDPNIVEMIFSMDLPIEVNFAILPFPTLKERYHDHPKFDELILKYKPAFAPRKYISAVDEFKVSIEAKALINAGDFPEFRKLFSNWNSEVRRDVARFKESVKFSEYKLLIDDGDAIVRWIVARNLDAPKIHPEFGRLLTDPVKFVENEALKNENAVDLPEYRKILENMALNPISKSRDEDYAEIFMQNSQISKIQNDLPYIVRKRDLEYFNIIVEFSSQILNLDDQPFFKVPSHFLEKRTITKKGEYQIIVVIPITKTKFDMVASFDAFIKGVSEDYRIIIPNEALLKLKSSKRFSENTDFHVLITQSPNNDDW